MNTAVAFVTDLASRGRYSFSTEQAQAALGVSLPAARAALRRLKKRMEIADPVRGFHVILPPEYRRLGCLPAEHFVPDLMAHLGEPYYVALLSAAELHGAAHHRPQVFQVMVPKNRRPITCGSVRVQFVARHDLESVPTVAMNTPRGQMRVSTPEATALDLVGYADHAAGLDNVATVLVELAERIDADTLAKVARDCPVVWAQRLGYLLELVERADLAGPLETVVKERATGLAPLVRSRSITGAPRVDRWMLASNATVEPDL